jgi:hypothetical protein
MAFCSTFDCYVSHAFQWRNGVRTDLGALPGGFSSASTSISSSGLIAGFSQNGEIDPLVSGFPEARAVLWNHGEIVNLGTMEGGYESAANAVNSHGLVVGGASNTIPDSNAMTLSVGLGYFFPGPPVSDTSVSMAERSDAGLGYPGRHRRPSGVYERGGASETGGSLVLDDAQGMGFRKVNKVRFARGKARNRRWCEVEHRVIGWVSRSSSRRSSK